MKYKALLLLVLLTGLLAAENITPGMLLFKTSAPLDQIKSGRTGLAVFDSYLDALGTYQIKPLKAMPGNRWFSAHVSSDPDWQAVKSGSLSFPGIDHIQPNYLNEFHIAPNDPLYTQQFHYVTNTPQAWNMTTGSQTVLVGIVDSGVLADHADLTANIYINPNEIPDDGIDNDGNGYIDDWRGWDFADAPELINSAIGDYVDRDNDPTDENFHGTHVAGIVGAVGNNGIGIAGVAWNVKILPIRAGFRTTGGEGYLQDDDAAAAVIYAADMGCNVVNMSWGDANYSPIIGDACQYAYDMGVTLVASAGNNPGPYLSYPAKLSTVISVGAVNKTRNLAGFSSWGVDMDLVAPGEAVLSTYKLESDQLYFEQSGTSMSSPFVVGAVALLLSLHPGLTPEEVRTRLCNSTTDLGPVGFDPQYGHGLLNVQALLESVSPPLVSISYPYEQAGVSASVPIIGTIQAEDFFRYSVMFTNKQVPTILDWLDVTNHTNNPVYHTQPVNNATIAQFYIPELFPEGNYSIRIQYETRNGRKYNTYRNVLYDCSLPELREETLAPHFRYDGQNIRYYATAIFNEDVRSELRITASDGSTHLCHSALLDSLQVWALPQDLPQGPIDIVIRATNSSNLTFVSATIPNFLNIAYESVPNYGFIGQNIGQARVPLSKMHDYNGDGTPEYIAMNLPTSGIGNALVYQPEAGGHVVKHDFQDNFWLLDSGNTNAIGQEMLILRGDTAELYDTQTTHTYPNLNIWSDTAISGGTLSDYNGDGVDDILLVKNLTAERVVQAYRRISDSEIEAKNTLHNTTPTSVRNTFVPTIIVKNFDNDTYRDILTADTDGDLMMFEIRNDNVVDQTWTYRMPVTNTYSLTSGDYDGDNRQEFFVGGYVTDILNPHLNFWFLQGFKSTGNNAYASMGNLTINNVQSQNSIQSFDLDNDGKDEIILALSPNLYVLKYVDGNFKPIFYGNSFRSYQCLAYRDANDRTYFLTNYQVDPDSIVAREWTTDDPFTGPQTPANLFAKALDHQTISLTWIANGADSYRLYRMDEENNLIIYDGIIAPEYIDTDVLVGKTYRYAVAAVHSSYSPPESHPCLWVSATPNYAPVLQEIRMIGPLELRMTYDQRLADSVLNPGCYEVDNGIGTPVSVNNIAGQNGLLLRFATPFQASASPYTIMLKNFTGLTGVGPLETEHIFEYEEDTQAPGIVSAAVSADRKSVDILMSEPISADNPNPLHLLNYQLFSPPSDPDNAIVSVAHDSDHLVLTFRHQLRFSNQAYQVSIFNIADLCGNVISQQYNTARLYPGEITDLKKIVTYPNPVKTAKDSWCAFINFPNGKQGNIRIFNSAGDLVYKSVIGPFDSSLNNVSWRWALTNNDSKKVASGVYFWVIEMDGESARGKIAVIR
jgi:subtilisin family serine protease